LERKWSAARLAALRMQLSPHTLFNLLHTIRGNIEWEPRVAQSMVVQLADLLRRLLSAGERDFSRVTDELQFCGMYLELQQRRFPDRMSFTLPDPAQVPSAWVPSLILQPLVENAVVHGLSGHQGAVAISVDARLAADTLHLRVANTVGPGRAAAGEGIGLRNVRERLAVQFGSRGTLQTASANGSWTVDIAMPAIQSAATGAAFAGELRA
jgi:LytS/YehU family sensor histidine kinase